MPNLTNVPGRYLAADRKLAREYQISSRHPATWKQNRHHWKMFSNYLGSADPWKASPEDTAAYCASLADQGYSPHTIEAHLSSLTFHYERLGKGFEHGHMGKGIRKDNPVRTPLVRATMRGIKLVHIRPAVKMLPMMLDTLEKLIDVQPDTLIGFRNKALLSMSWAAALRASETSGLDISQNGGGNGFVEFTDDGIVVILKRSKMNLSGSHWERYGIPSRATAPRYCPRKLLQDWLDISGLTAGPLLPSVRCNYVNQPIRSERINIHTVTKIIRQGLTHLYQRRELLTCMRPISHSNGHDGFGLIDEFIPSLASGLDDGVVIFEDAV